MKHTQRDILFEAMGGDAEESTFVTEGISYLVFTSCQKYPNPDFHKIDPVEKYWSRCIEADISLFLLFHWSKIISPSDDYDYLEQHKDDSVYSIIAIPGISLRHLIGFSEVGGVWQKRNFIQEIVGRLACLANFAIVAAGPSMLHAKFRSSPNDATLLELAALIRATSPGGAIQMLYEQNQLQPGLPQSPNEKLVLYMRKTNGFKLEFH